MSSGNSIYIAGSLLCDPIEKLSAAEVHRVIGNLGRPGITLLIAPPDLKSRESDTQTWKSVNHNVFDGTLENHFQKTSIHLSFTRYELPLVTENTARHLIDRVVNFVETLVSVYDGGTWVTEIDILKALKSPVSRATCGSLSPAATEDSFHAQQLVHRHATGDQHTYQKIIMDCPQLIATSVENWDELIEAPSSGVIAFRAHKNWLARLAATVLCVRHGFKVVVLPEDPCWACCAAMLDRHSPNRYALIC